MGIAIDILRSSDRCHLRDAASRDAKALDAVVTMMHCPLARDIRDARTALSCAPVPRVRLVYVDRDDTAACREKSLANAAPARGGP